MSVTIAAALLLLSTIPPSPSPSTRATLVSQLGHNSYVHAVAFSPDAALVLTASEDQTARLWEAATGAELRTFTGHTQEVKAVALSPDGRRALTGSRDESARLWDVETGEEVRRFAAGRGGVNAVAFSPDGHSIVAGSWDFKARVFETATGALSTSLAGHVGGVLAVAWSADGNVIATGSFDHTARLWDARTGTGLRTLSGHRDAVTAVAISHDGRLVLTGSMDDTAKLWDARTGLEVKTFTGHANDVTSVALSRDGSTAVTASFDKTAIVWALPTGAELRRLVGHTHWLSSVAISNDGRLIATGSHDRTATLWDAATGHPVTAFSGRINLPWAAAFSPDGRFIVTGNRDGTARLWEGATGEQALAYTGHSHWVTSVAFSPDGATLLTGSWDATVRLWDVASGMEGRVLHGLDEPVTSVAFSSDGTRVLAGGWESAAKLWDAASGAELHAFESRGEPADSTAISRDGRFVATARRGRAVLWDAATGAEVRELSGHVEMLEVRAVAFSPDARFLLTGGGDATAKLWDVETGAELRTFNGHAVADTVDAVAFSPDGRFVLTASSDQTAKVWDASTGAELRTMSGHRGLIHTISVSRDGRFVLTSSADGTARVWDFESGRLLCSLLSFQDGGWAVIDPEGRFDAADGGDVAGLHWAVGTESIGLGQLKNRYYVPALLARILGFDDKPLDPVAALDQVSLFPGVRVEPPAAGATKLTIHLTNRGGGIGKVRVLVNRKELLADARGPRPDSSAREVRITVDLASAPALPGEPNHIEIVAWNRDDYLSSRGAMIPWSPPAGEKYEPELYAIVGGISEYASPKMALRFAAKDAVDIATAVELGAQELFGVSRVHLTLLASGDPRAADPTKDKFRQAFERARKARPGDLLVVYLAGHGVAVGGEQKVYAYLTREATGFDVADPEVRKRSAITSEELTEWIKEIPALKQVMILDTCAAGTAAAKLIERRAVPGDQVRALERLKDRTGFHVLMGSAADAVSYEASEYAQGLLTYALLEGMRGAALREDDSVDVAKLVQYAADRVPQLARNIGGIQRPQVAAPQGSSFAIGILGPDEKKRIPISMPRPLVLRPILFNPAEADDNLQLSVALRKALDRHAFQSSQVVFVDADELPGAVRVTGVYQVVAGGQVNVSVTLRRDDARLATVLATGRLDDLRGLVANLAKEISAVLAGDALR